MQVVKQTAERLKALHAAGYVHRDLKPANVMWLPRENRWTVIDFGCVAPVRSKRRAALSVRYAAPEAVAAHRGGRAMLVEESLDAWSLGVLAYELLTGAPWTGLLEGNDKVTSPHNARAAECRLVCRAAHSMRSPSLSPGIAEHVSRACTCTCSC